MKRKANKSSYKTFKKSRREIDSDDEEHEDVASTIALSTDRSFLSGNKFGRCGKIHSIRLINFMCHSNLYIKFGPNINFLVGSNGSGKSAILTALVLGFGCSARETERASAISSLVKNGETNASIEITISNVGVCPFQPDIYGPRITVVRNIRHSTSQYQLKDAKGNIVSKKLSDLRRILTRFGIHPENPVFVLNQDTARQFLKTLEPSSNFDLIMKATRLDISSNSLTSCHAKRAAFNFDCDMLKERIENMEKSLEEEEEKIKMIENCHVIKEDLKKSKIKLAWLAVKRCKDELTALEQSIAIIETRTAELSKKVNKKDKIEATLSQQLSQLAESKARLAEKAKIQEKKAKEALSYLQDCQQKIREVERNIQNVERRIAEQKRIKQDCQNRLENYNAEHAKALLKKEAYESQRKELEARIQEIESIVKSLRSDQENFVNLICVVNIKLQKLKNQILNIKKGKHDLRTEIDGLTRNKMNKVSVYGNTAVQIINALRIEYKGPNRHNRPRGPLGKYITVPNSKYRNLVEAELFNCLNSYIVTSDAQRKSLRNLFEAKYPSGNYPPIITTVHSDRVYNVSQYKVRGPPNSFVLIDIVKCDDPVVMNYLIDMFRIESVLIVESKEMAEFLTSETENVPPNMSRVIVPHLGIEYYPSPSYAVYSRKYLPARFLQVNADDRIQQIQCEIDRLHEEQTTLQSNYDELNNEKEIYSTTMNTNLSTIKERNEEYRTTMSTLIDLEHFDYHMPEHNVLKTLLDSGNEKLNDLMKEEQNLHEQRTSLVEFCTQAAEKEKHEIEILRNIHTQSVEIETSSKAAEIQIRDLDNHFEENKRNFAKTMQLHENYLKQKKELEADLVQVREAAKKRGDCIETDETEDQLHETIGRYKAQMKQFDLLNYDADQVKEKISSLHTNIKLQMDNLNTVRNVIKKLRLAYHKRAQRFQNSRRHLFTLVEFYMQHALGLRNFSLKFITNHTNRTVDIMIYPPSGNKTSNTKTLSGGERSYGTVSLLKGLWSSSDHPFYFLDEYDVFTDEVNRTFITELLIQEGVDFQDRQYCFLTPQDTKVDAHPLIKIHKLEMPERN